MPSDVACPHALVARDANASVYSPPLFQLRQITREQLATATAGPPPDGASHETPLVFFLIEERRDGFSNGEMFTPGVTRGRAYL